MTSQSTRRKTGLAFLAAFEYLDVKTHLSLRAPTCMHIFAPASYSTRAPLSNTEFATHLSKLKEVIVHFSVVPKEVMEDEQQNRVIIWATGEPTFLELKDDGISKEEWGYKGEYMFILSMDQSGEKIERIVEFLDSKAATGGGRALVARARANLEKRQPENK